MDGRPRRHAVQVTPSQQPAEAVVAADAELRTLLQQLHKTSGLTYEQLAELTHLSRGTMGNYLTKPNHRRGTRELEQLLDALGAAAEDRARALELHRQTVPGGPVAAEVGWRARARTAGCTVWSMAEFSAAQATVHTAIGRRISSVGQHAERPGEMGSPAYVPRAHDPALRADLTAAAASRLSFMIVLRGTSSTGKTRSLWEAVQALGHGWMVIRPRSAAAARALPEAGLWDRPIVVWLNELQGFLGPDGTGLSVDVLRDLRQVADAPLVAVGTLWPDKIHNLTGGGRDDIRSEAHQLLTGPSVRWHDVAPTLTTPTEKAAARELATRDPRLARAIQDPDRVGFAQTLAGAHELLEHYRNAPTMAGLLLDAAADVRRLGHTHALRPELLQAVAHALWDDQHAPTLPPGGWLKDALGYATRPLRSDDGVRALIPIDTADDTGYELADYLQQHFTQARRTRQLSDRIWRALLSHSPDPDDLEALGKAAKARGHFTHAEQALRTATAAGNPFALKHLANLLTAQSRVVEAEEIWRDAATLGTGGALTGLAVLLAKQPGRGPEAEHAWREAAAAGDTDALGELAKWLATQPGRTPDTEHAWRHAAAANPSSIYGLTEWLAKQPGREPEVEQAWRDAAATGNPDALSGLAGWLARQPERETDAEQAWRDAAATGDSFALWGLARWLAEQPGQEPEAEKIWRAAATIGGSFASVHLAQWLAEQPGRETETEQAWRDAVAAGIGGRCVSWPGGWPSSRATRLGPRLSRFGVTPRPTATHRRSAGWPSGWPSNPAGRLTQSGPGAPPWPPANHLRSAGWPGGLPGSQAGRPRPSRPGAPRRPTAIRRRYSNEPRVKPSTVAVRSKLSKRSLPPGQPGCRLTWMMLRRYDA